MLAPRTRIPRIFVSYLRDDSVTIDRLVADLQARGVVSWYDRNALRPGMLWKDEIRRAIQDGDFFVACFSRAYATRGRTYMNEELEVAIDEMRLRLNRTWFIPVLLSGTIPDIAISANQRLTDFHYLDFTSVSWASGVDALAAVVTRTVDAKIAQERAWLNTTFPPEAPVEVIHYEQPSELLLEQPRDHAFVLPRYLSLPADAIRGDVARAISMYRTAVHRQLSNIALSPVEDAVLLHLLNGPLLRPGGVDRFYVSIAACVAGAFPGVNGDPSLPQVKRLMRECFDQDGEWQLRLFKIAEEPVAAFLEKRPLKPMAR